MNGMKRGCVRSVVSPLKPGDFYSHAATSGDDVAWQLQQDVEAKDGAR